MSNAIRSLMLTIGALIEKRTTDIFSSLQQFDVMKEPRVRDCEASVRSFKDSGGNCLCLVTPEPLGRGSHASWNLMDGVI